MREKTKMKKLLISAVIVLTGCGAPQQPSEELVKGINTYATGVFASEILRVPIKEDGVVCYVAMESRVMKSINCVKVEAAK